MRELMKKFSKREFEQIVLYIINQINGKELGKVKLNKILWFSDLEKYMETGSTITNCRYCRQNHGPISRSLDTSVNALEINGCISRDRENDESMWLYTPIKQADISFLKDEDKIIIDKQIERIRPMKAKDISAETHTATWEALENGAEMPVSLVAMEKLVNNDIDVKWN